MFNLFVRYDIILLRFWKMTQNSYVRQIWIQSIDIQYYVTAIDKFKYLVKKRP
jgi:hypothetical protein